MMEEEVILVNPLDEVVGKASKKEAHIYRNIMGGMLHRAFSVFLFSPDGKLLLQQRSEAKITFPLVWANTCCSHPLSCPSELVEVDELGIKNAAIRKLEQELGIKPEEIPLSSFRFMTRVHYMAPCSDMIWGEHEMDYILICTPPVAPKLRPNPNEVNTTKYFTRKEFSHFLSGETASRGVLLSPWFRVISKMLLPRWWDALERNDLASVIQPRTIYRCGEVDHFLQKPEIVLALKKLEIESVSLPGCCSSILLDDSKSATDLLDSSERVSDLVADGVKKQGAYGKVRTHTEGVLSQLKHIDEIFIGVMYKCGLTKIPPVKRLSATAPRAQVACEKFLDLTSRSFSMVIKQLPPRLRASIGVFYLVLRGLDTVEDDMKTFSQGREAEKLYILRHMHEYIRCRGWTLCGVGEADEKALLENFTCVVDTLLSLDTADQEIICDVCCRMGEGMASFVSRDLREGTNDLADYDLYCHYVAGLVGEGLSSLFSSSGLEGPEVADQKELANHMGLFLQKTNIIRDYLEDLVDGRAFWPKEIWSLYSPTLALLRADQGPNEVSNESRLACLNHLVADAMRHAPYCLRYMEKLKDSSVFRFCGIPQVMAISTLDKVTSNLDVFTGVVKIRKGLAVRLMTECGDLTGLLKVFLQFSDSIMKKVTKTHKTVHETVKTHVDEIIDICTPPPETSTFMKIATAPISITVVFFVFLWSVYWLMTRSHRWLGDRMFLPRITDSLDVSVLALCVGCIVFLISLGGIPILSGLDIQQGVNPDNITFKPISLEMLSDRGLYSVPTSKKVVSEGSHSSRTPSPDYSAGEGRSASPKLISRSKRRGVATA